MKTLKQIFRLVLNWRLALFLVAVAAMWLVPFKEDFNLARFEGNWLAPFVTWANFDGEHYLSLAEAGYLGGLKYSQAFFPLYPSIIRWFFHLGIPSYLTAMVVSHTALILGLWYLYRLIRLDLKDKPAQLAILTLLSFPTAFYFGSVYTESLFLFLSIASFWYARKQKWTRAVIFALLASATRVTGILVGMAIVIEYLEANKWQLKSLLQRQGWWLALAPLGLFGYMNYLQKHFGDALMFLHVQPFFGAERSGDRLILLHQVFYRYAKMMIFVDHSSGVFLVALLELATALLFLGLILLLWRRRKSYFFYSLFSFMIPTLTGTFSSLPRYVVVIFPAFMLLGVWLSKLTPLTQKAYLLISALLLALLTMLFTRGHFVA